MSKKEFIEPQVKALEIVRSIYWADTDSQELRFDTAKTLGCLYVNSLVKELENYFIDYDKEYWKKVKIEILLLKFSRKMRF